jgi:hypothetical protein
MEGGALRRQANVWRRARRARPPFDSANPPKRSAIAGTGSTSRGGYTNQESLLTLTGSQGHYGGVGRGCGLGRALGSGVGLGVAVGVGVGVGLGLTVGVAVGVGLGVGVGAACNWISSMRPPLPNWLA